MATNTVFDPFSLKDKLALVTGAAGHLGQQMVWALAKAGAHVILVGRDETKLADLADKLRLQGHETSVCAMDLTDHQAIEEQIPLLLDRWDRLDVLINNAYSGKPGSMQSASLEQFTNAYEITVVAAYQLIQHCMPYLKAAASQNGQTASVINISTMYASVSPNPSIYQESGMNNPPFYGAAKAGLAQLTRYLACHLAADNIRVNTVSPGPFPLPTLEEEHPDFFKALCEKVPMKRVGQSCEIQGPILFLASEASSYVTGADIKVDGGWTAW